MRLNDAVEGVATWDVTAFIVGDIDWSKLDDRREMSVGRSTRVERSVLLTFEDELVLVLIMGFRLCSSSVEDVGTGTAIGRDGTCDDV